MIVTDGTATRLLDALLRVEYGGRHRRAENAQTRIRCQQIATDLPTAPDSSDPQDKHGLAWVIVEHLLKMLSDASAFMTAT